MAIQKKTIVVFRNLIPGASLGFLKWPSLFFGSIAIHPAPYALTFVLIPIVIGISIWIARHHLFVENNDQQMDLDSIINWIGRPSPPEPLSGSRFKTVRTFEGDHVLRERTIHLIKILGSGLAGTVYLVEDDQGDQWVEKHYGTGGQGSGKRLGRWATKLIFFFFRQSALSYRLLPEAAIASHLTNRIVTLAARERFQHDPAYAGRDVTPSILYTRYDTQTGGYVHAFPFVAGHPLRTWSPGLPLLGEAGLHYRTMQVWRDFLAKDLGFWGLARQVDPANLNASTNLWVTPGDHVVLLDIVPGVPGFLELRYLWWGLLRGQWTPFGDAIDFRRLRTYIEAHPNLPAEAKRRLPLLELATQRWQASEPRLVSAPLRWAYWIFNPYVKQWTRLSLLSQLEFKGAISAEKATYFRAQWAATGALPHLWGAALSYFWRSRPRWPQWQDIWTGMRTWWAKAAMHLKTVLRLLWNRGERAAYLQEKVESWIAEDQSLGRLTTDEATHFRGIMQAERGEAADLLDIFAVHSLLPMLTKFFGISSLASFTLWVVTNDPRFLFILAIDPILRAGATVLLGRGMKAKFLRMAFIFSLLPIVGSAAAPICLLLIEPELGGFLVRTAAQRLALRIPAFGERGSLTEMIAVSTAQILIVDQARILPSILMGIGGGLLLHQRWILGVTMAGYLFSVINTVRKRWRPNPTITPKFGIPYSAGSRTYRAAA